MINLKIIFSSLTTSQNNFQSCLHLKQFSPCRLWLAPKHQPREFMILILILIFLLYWSLVSLYLFTTITEPLISFSANTPFWIPFFWFWCVLPPSRPQKIRKLKASSWRLRISINLRLDFGALLELWLSVTHLLALN